jgi:hypothetical protein
VARGPSSGGQTGTRGGPRTSRATTDTTRCCRRPPRAHGPPSSGTKPPARPSSALPLNRGAQHGDHHQGPQQARARLGPQGLADALAHAVVRRRTRTRRDERPGDIFPGASHFLARLCRPADRPLGRSALGHSTGSRAGPRAGGQPRWSGVSTPPRHDTQVLGRRSTAVIPDRAATGELIARPVALTGSLPDRRPRCALLASIVGT